MTDSSSTPASPSDRSSDRRSDRPEDTPGTGLSDDDLWLDALFGRLVAALSDGRDVEPLLSLPPDRSHLADDVRSLLSTARRIVSRSAPEKPVVPGFVIDRLLGAGGMGKVYLALDERLGRRVALKLLPARMASGRARARFEREARAVARLDHPLIVPVHGMGEDAGHLWFSMQYVEGRTLAQIASAARSLGAPPESLTGEDFARYTGLPAGATLPAHWRRDWVAACVRAAADAADALAHAHSQGVVHRDVKPSNLLVRPDGFTVVFDFGLADVEDETTLTLTRGFLGTPHYASPEQAAGDAASLDARSDVWSLGATLFEMLTFAPPFAGPTTHEVLRRIQAWDPEPASRTNPLVPADLDAVLRRCLRKEREERYPSAADLAADLRAVLEGRAVSAEREGLLSRGLRIVKRNRALTELLVEQRTRNAELRDLLRRAEDARRDAEAARAEAERERAEADAARAVAETERDRATRTADCFREFLRNGDVAWGSRDTRVCDLLPRLAEVAAERLGDAPDSLFPIQLAIADSLANAGDYAGARTLAAAASELATKLCGPDSIWALRAESLELQGLRGTPREAVPRLKDLLDRVVRHHPRDTALTHDVMISLMSGESGLLRHEESAKWGRRLLAEIPADDTLRRLSALLQLSHSELHIPGRAGEGLALAREHFDLCRREHGDIHAQTTLSRMNLARALARHGDPAAAHALLVECMEAVQGTFGPDHIAMAGCTNRLAEVCVQLGRPAEALDRTEQTLRIYDLVGHRLNPVWETVECRRMVLLDELGRRDEARTVARGLRAYLVTADQHANWQAHADEVDRILAGEAPGQVSAPES